MYSFLKSILHRRNRGDLWLVFVKMAHPFLGFIGSVVVARHLLPEELGLVQSVMLIATYLGFLQLGVFNGLNRNFPLYRAKNESKTVQEYVNASWTVARWVAFIGATIAIIVLACFAFSSDDRRFALAAMALVPTLWLIPQTTHLDAIQRGARQFGVYGTGTLLNSLVGLGASILTAVIGLPALILKHAIQHLPSRILFGIYNPAPATAAGELRRMRELATCGFPMLLTGILFAYLSAADRTIIALTMGVEHVGFYALSGMIVAAMIAIPTTINMLLLPRIAHAYGATNRASALRRYVWIGLGLNVAILLPAIAVIYAILPYLVEAFLPAYSPGLTAAQITLIGMGATIYSGPSAVIPVLRKNLSFIGFYLVAILILWGFGLIAVRTGYGIEGVAYARLAAFSFICVVTLFFIFFLTRKANDDGAPASS